MNEMKKRGKQLLNRYVGMIEDSKIKGFIEKCLFLAPDYFWIVPASKSGRFHPRVSLGDGGLVRHTILTVHYGVKICKKNNIEGLSKDKIIAALILHDSCKAGVQDEPNHTHYPWHAYIPKKKFEKLAAELESDVAEEIFGMVDSHMGEWSTRRSKIPKNKMERISHYADYLASRKDQPITDFKGEIKELKTYDRSIVL